MSLHRRLGRVVLLIVTMQFVALPKFVHAQGRPSGDAPRLWLELGLSAAGQSHRCVTCDGSATAGGLSATAAAGVTLPQGFGVGLLGRAFSQFSIESSRQSRYVVALAQYAPPALSLLTLNMGGGWGRHTSDSDITPSDGSGAVFYAGAALRLPPRSGLAVTLTADLLQSIDGTPASHPRLLSAGISLGAATPSPAPPAP